MPPSNAKAKSEWARWLVLYLIVLAASGCTAGDDPSPSEDLIIPRGLEVKALPGGSGVLEITALTLRRGPQHLELYAALQNRGQVPACHAALSVELFDKAEQSLTAGITGLLTQHFYRLTDGSNSIAACVGPSDVTMAAVTDLDADVALEDVGSVVYHCPYFALDVERVDGLHIESVRVMPNDMGQSYQGVLVNGFAMPVLEASVSVFPTTHAGRPVGLITVSDTVTLAAGSSWTFTTGSVSESALDYAAYPAGAIQIGAQTVTN